MKKIIIILNFFIFALSVHSQSKEDDIRKLLEISGSEKLGIQVIEAMVEQMKKLLPDIPNNYWNLLKNEFNGKEFVELIVPLYDYHFTHNEIKDIISFYNTPTGKKLVNRLPILTEESMDIGRKYGEEIGNRIINKLKKDGYIKA